MGQGVRWWSSRALPGAELPLWTRGARARGTHSHALTGFGVNACATPPSTDHQERPGVRRAKRAESGQRSTGGRREREEGEGGVQRGPWEVKGGSPLRDNEGLVWTSARGGMAREHWCQPGVLKTPVNAVCQASAASRTPTKGTGRSLVGCLS